MFSQYMFAQTGNIAGKIYASDNNPAENVIVSLKNTSFTTKTDANGEYVLGTIPFGKYVLIASMTGVATKQESIELNKATLIVDFILDENSIELTEVAITTQKSVNEKTTSIGKIPIKPFDLPQTTVVIERDVLEKQQTNSMSDVLKNTNGVYIMGTSGGYQEEIAGRGFAFNSTNTFKNGIRYNNAIMPEMSAIERIEIIKGGTAILFGNVSAGGIINLVTKKPLFTTGGEVGMRIGSYNNYKPTLDLYGALNKKKTAAFRINTTYDNSKSFRDTVKSERIYINPSLLFKIGSRTDVLIEGDYLSDNRTADFGVGAINYALVDIPRSTFLGVNWSNIKSEQKSSNASISYRLNEKWQLKSVSSIQFFNNDLFANVRPNASGKFIQEDGAWIRGIQRTQVDEDYYISQLDLTSKFKTGFLSHSFLFGADIDKYISNTTAYNGISAYDTINIFNIDPSTQRNDIPDLTKKTETVSPRDRVGVYVQDLIGITDQIKVLAGVRFSYLETRSKVYTYSTNTTVETTLFDHAFSPRFGLVYQPIKTMSIFSSYSNSFTPNTGVDINGKALDPSIIDQYEAGVKNDFYRGLISVNLTVYQIKNSNLAQQSLANGNTNTSIKELAGEVTSNGFEVDITTKTWKGFCFIGGYSYNETKYTKSAIYKEGSRLLYNPMNTANASLYYEVKEGKLKGLNAGVSSVYIGKRSAGRLTRLTVENDSYKAFPVPEYVQFDATIGYSINKLSFRFKVANIFNVLSYNVHDDNSVNPIAPTFFSGSLSIKL